MVDEAGLPRAVDIERGSRSDVHSCSKVVSRLPKGSILTADRAYDIPWFREKLVSRGIMPNIRVRAYYQPKIHGLVPGKPAASPLIYQGRWKVERTIAWMGQFKRLLVRFERCDYLYKAFWQLGCSILVLKQITG